MMKQLTKKAALAGQIDDLLQSVAAEQARSKQAAANSELGSQGGETSHPSKDVDDRTKDVETGARFTEHSTDTKELVKAVSVDSTPESPNKGEDSPDAIGMNPSSTGTDPTHEKDFRGGGAPDPGSSSPARTDNTALDDHKYASFSRDMRALMDQSSKIGSALLAKIAVDTGKPSAPAPAPTPTPAVTATPSDKAAGKDLANVVGDFGLSPEDKQAADQMVVDSFEHILALADVRAEKLAEYYTGRFKRAEGEEEEGGEDPVPAEGGEDAAALAAMGGGGPPADGGGAGAGGGISAEEILALLAGGQGMGGDEAAAAMGGGGAPGGPAGGGDEIAALLAAAGGGGAGGMPAEGGGMPAEGGGAGGMDDAAALQAALAQLGMSQQEVQAAVTKRASAQIAAKSSPKPKSAADQAKVAKMVSTLQELMGR